MTAQPIVQLTSIASVVASIPHQLGFTPQDSIVVMGLDHGRVACMGRLDADDVTAAHLRDVLLPSMRRRSPVDAIVVFGYDETGAAVAAALVDDDELYEAIHVKDVVVVVNGRYRSLTHDDEGPLEPTNPELAEFVYRGSNPAPTRAGVEAAHKPSPIGIPDYPDPSKNMIVLAWQAILDGTYGPYDLAAVTHDIAVRDALIAGYIKPSDIIDEDSLAWANSLPVLPKEDVLDHLLAAARAGNTACLWAVYATACWVSGDGLRTDMALHNALAVDPTYSLALLISAMSKFSIKLPGGTPRWS